MNFICTVSPRFPENYHLGQNALLWGVEEKYETRIRRTNPGDLLFFSRGSSTVLSLHRIESEVFRDEEEVWPEKDGSFFPYRIRISPPLAAGEVPLAELASRISFMKDKERWTGTLRGPNGVFNDRLTDEDAALIRSRMREVREPRAHTPKVQRQKPKFPVKLFEAQIEHALLDLLEQLGCERGLDIPARRSNEQVEHFTMVGRHRLRREAVVVVLDGGAGNSSVLLHALRDMSYVRQKSDARTDIRGMILTGQVTEDLSTMTRAIDNLNVRRYQLRLQLDPDPDEGMKTSRGVA